MRRASSRGIVARAGFRIRPLDEPVRIMHERREGAEGGGRRSNGTKKKGRLRSRPSDRPPIGRSSKSMVQSRAPCGRRVVIFLTRPCRASLTISLFPNCFPLCLCSRRNTVPCRQLQCGDEKPGVDTRREPRVAASVCAIVRARGASVCLRVSQPLSTVRRTGPIHQRSDQAGNEAATNQRARRHSGLVPHACWGADRPCTTRAAVRGSAGTALAAAP